MRQEGQGQPGTNPDRFKNLALAMAKWKQDDPETYARFMFGPDKEDDETRTDEA